MNRALDFIKLAVALILFAGLISCILFYVSLGQSKINTSTSILSREIELGDFQYIAEEINTYVSGKRMKDIIYHYEGYYAYYYVTINSSANKAIDCPNSSDPDHYHYEGYYSYLGCSVDKEDNYINDSGQYLLYVDEQYTFPVIVFVQKGINKNSSKSLDLHAGLTYDYDIAQNNLNSILTSLNQAKDLTELKFSFNNWKQTILKYSNLKIKQLKANHEAFNVNYWKTKIYEVLINHNSVTQDAFSQFRREDLIK